MSRELAQCASSLVEGLLGPLVLGGETRLSRPIGPARALALGVERTIEDVELRSRIGIARVRQARLLAPIDTLPDLSPHEWALASALNDLLQTTNHHLSGPLTRSRHTKLLGAVSRLLANIPGPPTALEALARHATFARALELVRVDVQVTWWTGSQAFRGEPVPNRLKAWPSLRRVNESSKRVPLHSMHRGAPVLVADGYVAALSRWLALTPLTDLATMSRDTPAFRWSAETLALVSTPVGRTLALRALSRLSAPLVARALGAAEQALPRGSVQHAIATSFASEQSATRPAAPTPAASR